MNKIEFKQKIIELLKEKQISLKRCNYSLTESFIRGFIMGAEAITDIPIPSHWYEEIIKEVENE